jgi:phage terminase large subunit-like protein
MQDYVSIAIAYAKGAIADKKRVKHCEMIRQAAKRFLDDLNRAGKDSCIFYFDEWHANHPCDFIEKLPHIEGVWSSPDIELHPSHVFFVVQLFGFRNRITGNRRFTSALFAVARKNAKSTLASGIMLYCMCWEDEPGAQLISAATTYDQAAIIFKVAKAMVERTQDLREGFNLAAWAKAITRLDTGASFKALHAKASTQDGLNPSHVSLDEIHAHKNPDLLNVLTSAAGARANPLWLYTTTEGYTNPGPWAEIRKFAKRLLAGVFGYTADHFLVVFYALDNEDKTHGIEADDEFDESKWIKANPLMDVNPHLAEAIRKEAIEAKQMPSKLAEFRIKRCNREASTASGWVDLTKWQKCGAVIDVEKLKQYPCYGGLDLASTTDLCAFRLVWPNIDGKIYTLGWRWAPESAVAQRTERNTVPYAGWVEEGHLKQTEGDVTDYDVIFADIKALGEIFQIEEIAYDRWNATQLVNNLVRDGFVMIEFIQGPKSYHPAMQALEMAYVGGTFVHNHDPVLNWCASNLVARKDDNLNNAPDKKKSVDKIDDMTALLMAMGISLPPPAEEEKTFPMFFLG